MVRPQRSHHRLPWAWRAGNCVRPQTHAADLSAARCAEPAWTDANKELNRTDCQAQHCGAKRLCAADHSESAKRRSPPGLLKLFQPAPLAHEVLVLQISADRLGRCRPSRDIRPMRVLEHLLAWIFRLATGRTNSTDRCIFCGLTFDLSGMPKACPLEGMVRRWPGAS
jgi:hypothetical protein